MLLQGYVHNILIKIRFFILRQVHSRLLFLQYNIATALKQVKCGHACKCLQGYIDRVGSPSSEVHLLIYCTWKIVLKYETRTICREDPMLDNPCNSSNTCCLHYYTSNKQLRNGKVVHVRAVIKSITPARQNASALLKDPTGRTSVQLSYQILFAQLQWNNKQ